MVSPFFTVCPATGCIFIMVPSAEDPEISVTIIIEGAGSGGDYAVPLAKRLFDAYFARTDVTEQ